MATTNAVHSNRTGSAFEISETIESSLQAPVNDGATVSDKGSEQDANHNDPHLHGLRLQMTLIG